VSRQAAELTRRLDWRFLLPRATFRRAVLSESDSALRDHARRLGLAPVVVERSDGEEADLMWISDADDLAVTNDLAVDGVVCCEVDRRRAPMLTPARLARRMGEAGLQPRGTWAVRPGLARAESYVPLDDAAPLPWYLKTQYRTTSRLQRFVATGVRVLVGRDGRRLARFAPFYVMVATRPDANADRNGDAGSVLVLTDSGDRATCLWFPADAREPRVVTKVPKSEAFVERTRHEQLMMVDLRAQLGNDLVAALPQPLGLASWGCVSSSRESVVPGVSLATRCRFGRFHAANARLDLRVASDWLARFQVATMDGACDVAANVDALFERYLDRFGDPGSGMIGQVRSLAATLPPIPSVIRHPDFNVWNLLRDGDRIHVIDWEGAAPGPPLCDLVQFAVHWHECVTRRRPLMPDQEGLRALLVERSQASAADAAVAEVFSRYMCRLAIPDQWFEVLAVTTWVERALRRERQLVDAGSSLEERDRNNFGVRYVEALAGAWRHVPNAPTHDAGVP
jgi:hypothetical protein